MCSPAMKPRRIAIASLPEDQHVFFNAWLTYYRLISSGEDTQAIQQTIEALIIAYVLQRGEMDEDQLQLVITDLQTQAEAQVRREFRLRS